MTNGLVKERMTYFYSDGIAYQAFNNLTGGATVLVYVNIGNNYVLSNIFFIDHRIANEEELKSIAVENETLRGLQ